MRTSIYVLLGLLTLTFPTASVADDADAKKYGTLLWEKDYPKAKPAPATEIELIGEYKFKPEWSVKDARVVFTPAKTGGNYSAPTALKCLNGKWGALDPKDKTKIVPAVVPLGKGEWTVWVTVTLEGKDASGTKVEVPFLAMLKNVEVK